MQQYLMRRLLQVIPTAIGASILVFLIIRVIPGDVTYLIAGAESWISEAERAALRTQLGLDRPLYEQYLTWIWGLVRLDAGQSLWTKAPISEEIGRRLPLSVELAVLSGVFSLLIGVPLGVLCAAKQNSWTDRLSQVFLIGGLAMPNFWVATMIIVLLVVVFSWLPPLKYASFLDDPSANLQQMIPPAVGLGYHFAAVVGRMTRSCMLEVLRQDYVRTARAKGLLERVILARHALKNALLPVATIAGVQIGILMGGSVIVESIFVLPGIGGGLIDAVTFRDYPTVQTIMMIFAVIVLLANLAVDLLYGWLDPRISYK
ncbi:MAG: ABC transporter permease [Chloroflexi bacterium]|nr:ABC transporter permease [Chloroflexota bacterium]